jgi:hypothetical protein
VPVLDGVTTLSSDGKQVAVAVINRDPARSAQLSFDLGGGKQLASEITLTILTGDSVDAYNDVAKPDRVRPEQKVLSGNSGPLTIPAHSVAIAQFTMMRYERVHGRRRPIPGHHSLNKLRRSRSAFTFQTLTAVAGSTRRM